MRVTIARAKKAKAGERPQVSYMMIHLTPEEALALAESLVRQVRTDDPNTGRPETLVHEGDFKGFVSLSVVHERCLQCGKEVEQGKLQKGGILCKGHETYREREERERQARLEATWAAQSKKAPRKKKKAKL